MTGCDAARGLASNFQPDRMKHRHRCGARPCQRQHRLLRIKRIIQQPGGACQPPLDKADRNKLGMFFKPQRIGTQINALKLLVRINRVTSLCRQKFIHVIQYNPVLVACQKDKANKPAGTFKIIESTGMQFIRQHAPKGIFAGCCFRRFSRFCRCIRHCIYSQRGVIHVIPVRFIFTHFVILRRMRIKDYRNRSSIARITFGEFGGVVDANQSTRLPSPSIRCL